MAKFIVGIVSTSLSHFAVDGDMTEEQAIEAARIKFANGDEEIMLGNEYEDIEKIFVDKD